MRKLNLDKIRAVAEKATGTNAVFNVMQICGKLRMAVCKACSNKIPCDSSDCKTHQQMFAIEEYLRIIQNVHEEIIGLKKWINELAEAHDSLTDELALTQGHAQKYINKSEGLQSENTLLREANGDLALRWANTTDENTLLREVLEKIECEPYYLDGDCYVATIRNIATQTLKQKGNSNE